MSRELREYLLGGLTAEERAGLEEGYLQNEDAFEELAACETDLIDAYVRGLLPEGERRRFEQQYRNSAERLARVEFAEALRTVGLNDRGRVVPQARRFRWAAIAAALVMAAGGAWLLVQDRTLPGGPGGARAEVRHGQPEAQPQNPPVGTTPVEPVVEPVVATIILTPGLTRDVQARGQALQLPPGAGSAVLRLSVAARYVSYEAEVETAEGQTVRRFPNVSAETTGKFVALRVPASALPTGDYIVRLSGIGADRKAEEIDVYGFQVK